MKFYRLLQNHRKAATHTITFGILDPVQMVQVCNFDLESVFISGWSMAATAAQEPGPDFGNYPMYTVPRKVEQLVNSQRFHDTKQHEARLRRAE